MAEARRTTKEWFERTGNESGQLDTVSDGDFQRYRAALPHLDAADREVISAAIERGQTHQQIARELGLATPDAAQLTLRRALIRLAERMDDAP